ncbi:MAG: hypothetical protein EKK42_32865 [Pseudonocardiaceae bacterium]|nr:MAG: hypothetical protein EKK42_32865 [Pseudonocardiaceae bacterium]
MFDERDFYAMREEMNDALGALQLHYGKPPVLDLLRSVASVEKAADVLDSKIEEVLTAVPSVRAECENLKRIGRERKAARLAAERAAAEAAE